MVNSDNIYSAVACLQAGRIPEEYLKNKGELTRESLLADYQNRDIPIDMSGLNFTRYSDKGMSESLFV